MKHIHKKIRQSFHRIKKEYFFVFLGLSIFMFLCVVGIYFFKLVPKNLHSISLVSTTTPAQLENLKLLGQAKLSYAGGTPGRNKNIELGVARINGTIIPPGKEFSFSKVLGLVAVVDGFSVEKVFQNGEVVKGVGGGLCQVSTTLFQAALHTGLPITERHNHTYSVSYYDVGLDATYSNPGPDLRFINDTGNPITIRGTAVNHFVTFQLYGVQDGRIASTTEPEIVDVVDFPPPKYVTVPEIPTGEKLCHNSPQIGYTTHVTYNILYKTGEKKEQLFTSVYRPLQRVCLTVESK